MHTPYKDFCELYNKNLKDEQENKDLSYLDRMRLYKSGPISFRVVADEYMTGIFQSFQRNLITLDQEDLDYLYNKYSKKLEEERQDAIKKLQEQKEKEIQEIEAKYKDLES